MKYQALLYRMLQSRLSQTQGQAMREASSNAPQPLQIRGMHQKGQAQTGTYRNQSLTLVRGMVREAASLVPA